jgi:TolB protein
MNKITLTIVPFLLVTLGIYAMVQNNSQVTDNNNKDEEPIHYPNEVHLKNVQQLTFGGNNAEAYFSRDDKQLVLQREHEAKGILCDQIFVADVPQSPEQAFKMNMVSTGKGRTTCSFFLPGDKAVLYASTHKANAACPEVPDWKAVGKYVWPLYKTFEIYYSDLEGNIVKQLTDNNYYDAEATVSPDGNRIVFTSTRSGDIELYLMNIDGTNVQQITHDLGYDGGAFFSPDSKQLIFRASRPTTPEAIKAYKDLLAQDLVAPTDMELFVCNVDGSNLQQITNLGKANWAPYFHPSGKKIIFSSNHQSERGFPFNLFMIDIDGNNLKQITFDDTFDSFPMFSYDGKKLVFASNRNNGETRDTNLFIADWVD